MDIFLRAACALIVAAVVQAAPPGNGEPVYWSEIDSLVQQSSPQGAPRVLAYMRLLEPDELVTAARQGCLAGENKPGLASDHDVAAAAESNALMCFEFYYEALRDDERGAARLSLLTKKLIDIVGDEDECLCLRRALAARLSTSPNTVFAKALLGYAGENLDTTVAILNRIVSKPDENARLREQAVAAIGSLLHERVSEICRSDANMRRALAEKREHSSDVVRAGDLLRSGEVTLTESSTSALKLVNERVLIYLTLLSEILANEEDHPERLVREAMRRLDSFRSSEAAALDGRIEEILQQSEK